MASIEITVQWKNSDPVLGEFTFVIHKYVHILHIPAAFESIIEQRIPQNSHTQKLSSRI
uniref:Uncharacterized protein n=1 Tax=Anguilla anguilla TaxID=7936 RepID=A0A0E9WLH1_ANGAN